MKQTSILEKITLSVVLVVVVMGLLATVFVFFYSQQELISREKEILLEESQEQAFRVETRQKTASEIVKTIARQDFAKKIIKNKKISGDKMDLTMLEGYSIGNYYLAIYLMDDEGNVLISTDKTFTGQNYAFRDYFKGSMRGEYYYDALVGVTSGELGYYYSAPIYNGSKVAGVAVTKLRESFIGDVINIEKNDSSNTFMADKNGVIISGTREDALFSTLGTISESERGRLLESKRYGKSKLNSLDYSLVQESLPGLTKTELTEFYDNKHKESEILAISPILEGKFYFMVEREADEVRKASFVISALLGSMVFFSALLVTVISYFSVKKYLSPLTELDRVIREISSGNYHARSKYFSNDEIGQISSTINSMAASIEESNLGMESKVEERTARLEKLNSFMVNRELKMVELKRKIKELEQKKDKK